MFHFGWSLPLSRIGVLQLARRFGSHGISTLEILQTFVSERKNVHYLTRVIHGLAHQPQDGEVVGVCPLHFVRKLYREFATEHQRRVAFKGGHIERDLLVHLNLPYLDLESLGCPCYDFLRHHAETTETCGWHAIPSQHHCAIAECVTFFEWYRHCMNPPRDSDEEEWMDTD